MRVYLYDYDESTTIASRGMYRSAALGIVLGDYPVVEWNSTSLQGDDLVVLSCHGSRYALLYRGEPFVTPDNVGCLAGSIVFAVSCDTGAGLGRIAVEKGVRAWIGFRESFMWVASDRCSYCDPLLDSYASMYFRPLVGAVYRLLRGWSTGKVVSWLRDVYDREYREAASRGKEYLYAASLLAHDASILSINGDKSARLSGGIPVAPLIVLPVTVEGARHVQLSR